MKFVISSSELLSHLQTSARVISNKNTLPILDNFLFKLSDNELEITSSDLETTMVTSIRLENASENGSIAIPARLLTDTLKEFGDQPLTFEINTDTMQVVIHSENGQFTIAGQHAADFPQIPSVKDESKQSIEVSAELLDSGITNTLFATANDELRPVMNGIYFELNADNLTFVASDAHKLVRYTRTDTNGNIEGSFILPKKAASLLKSMLPRENGNVVIEFDDKNAFFVLHSARLACRLVEGNYPSYNSVIPTENPNKMIIDRLELYNSLKRVQVFSNQASNLVKLQLTGNQVTVSAQDIDFSISAYERLTCQYEGDEMEIGFKSTFLVEILANIETPNVAVEMSDPSRAGLFIPADSENENEDVLMLLMPMMVNG